MKVEILNELVKDLKTKWYFSVNVEDEIYFEDWFYFYCHKLDKTLEV